ncbi:MAG: TonB-dependent receptor [Myxococcaceae bacterium]
MRTVFLAVLVTSVAVRAQSLDDAGVLPSVVDSGVAGASVFPPTLSPAGEREISSAVDAGADGGLVLPLTELSSAVDAGLLPLTPTLSPAGERELSSVVPPPSPSGKAFVGVRGRVIDARTGEGLIEATIKVLAGPIKKSALTDVDGNFKLKLPPGTYDLRVFYELYEGRKLTGVVVKPGEAVPLDVALSRDAKAVQEVVVEAKVDKRNEAALVQERKKAVVAQDSLGAQAIAKTPDSNAGDAVKRVVGATLVDGKYVFIRGLGGRYTQTLLNSTLMPSPEPDEPSVPLDLFPVGLLSNLNVIKTYTPELPATFAGGSVTIDTNTFPTKLEVKLRAQVSGDTMTTFQARPNEASTALESIGFANASRALPSAIPADQPLVPARIGGSGVGADVQKAAASAFSQRWTPGVVNSLPSGTFGFTAGDTFSLGREAKLGFLASGQISRRERRQVLQVRTISLDAGESDFTTQIGTVSGATSALLNAGLQLDRHHEISALGLYLFNADTSATTSAGFDQQETQNVTGSRLQFTARQLFFNQLKGTHRFPTLGDAELEWQLNYSRVNRDEPDIRDARYMVNADGSTQVRIQPNSVERFFLTLHEDQGGGTLNLTVPWRSFKFKAGGLGQVSGRSFDGRRFRYLGRLSAELEKYPLEELLVPERFGPPVTGDQVLTLEETTQAYDRYSASLAVYGGYVSTEWKPLPTLRALAGVRVEGSTQTLVGGSPFATGVSAGIPSVARQRVDVVPTANVVWSPTSALNLRASYAYTLARPSFRELAPFLFFDMVRRRNVSGNPDLVNTRIHNMDLRGEWFLGESDVIAVSAFAKQFEQPIERVIYGTSSLAGDVTFRNSKAATLIGGELEARSNLSRFSPALKPVTVGGNLSLIWSRIQLDPNSPQTNSARPLQGQSPFIANAFVTVAHPTWGTELGVFYNVYGPRISDVGFNGLPDIVEQPFHRLDVTVTQPLPAGLSLKVSAANVLNQAVRFQQNGVDVLVNPPGVQFMATLSWNLTEEKK